MGIKKNIPKTFCILNLYVWLTNWYVYENKYTTYRYIFHDNNCLFKNSIISYVSFIVTNETIRTSSQRPWLTLRDNSPGVQEGGARRAASKYNSDVGAIASDVGSVVSCAVPISANTSRRWCIPTNFELAKNDRRNIMLLSRGRTQTKFHPENFLAFDNKYLNRKMSRSPRLASKPYRQHRKMQYQKKKKNHPRSTVQSHRIKYTKSGLEEAANPECAPLYAQPLRWPQKE